MSKKPDGTKAKKNTDSKKEGKPQKGAAAKVVKPMKVKGPGPVSYAPNPERQKAKLAQQFAFMRADILAEQIKFVDFVAKVPGQYLVGTLAEVPEYMVLTVKMGGKFGNCLVIENEFGVYIPHSWIFVKDKEVKNLRFLESSGAQDQMDMLRLIKNCMSAEIREAKFAHWEAQQKKPAPVAKPVITTTTPVVIEQKEPGTPVNLPVWRNSVKKIGALVTNECYGYYDLSDEGHNLYVELRPTKGSASNEFVVREIDGGHYLANELISGMVVSVLSIKRQAPGLDSHIRGMLASGIDFGAVNRDRHALVTSGLPNITQATLLAA